MFVAQMPVHLADENPSVLVAHPPGNGHLINPAHHGVADKAVPAMVEAKPLQVLRQRLIFALQQLTLALRAGFSLVLAKRGFLAILANPARSSRCQQQGFPIRLGVLIPLASSGCARHCTRRPALWILPQGFRTRRIFHGRLDLA